MFCENCGNKITAGSKFCDYCGHKVQKEGVRKKTKITNEPAISINIDRYATAIFYDKYLLYKGKRTNYTDIDGYSYLLTRTKHSVNLIPTHTTVSFKIALVANGEKIDIVSSATSFMYSQNESQKEKQELYSKLVYVLDKLIKPYVFLNLLLDYSKENFTEIGSLRITKGGLQKQRFLAGPEVLPWDQYYNSIISEGNLYVLKSDEEKRYKQFFSCPISEINAVLVPDLLLILLRGNGVISTDLRTALEKQKKEYDFLSNENAKLEVANHCWSCDGLIQKDQKYCPYCGSKLI